MARVRQQSLAPIQVAQPTKDQGEKTTVTIRAVNRTEDEPHDRLTRLCATMTAALTTHSEYQGNEKIVVLLMDGTRGGIELHNYEDDADAIVDIFTHLQAILKTRGKTLTVTSLNHQGQG